MSFSTPKAFKAVDPSHSRRRETGAPHGIEGRDECGVPRAVFLSEGGQHVADGVAFASQPMDRGLADRRVFVERVKRRPVDRRRGRDGIFDPRWARASMSGKPEEP
jgi:hypothetical protein